MANSTIVFCKLSIRSFFAFSFLALTVSSTVVRAQTSSTDGSTPLALSPGAPSGSYSLNGYESVNAYNGNLSFRLPLLQIGGRGSAGYTITLPLEQHWRVLHKSNDNQTIELPSANPWKVTTRRYAAGQLEGRVGTSADLPCPPLYHTTTLLARLTFTAADGTEYELHDQLTGGQPQNYFCGGGAPYPSRGTVFVTADGTSATFISDSIIRDDSSAINPSGFLSLRDGTRYRIEGGSVTSIRDRNGNQLRFSYGRYIMNVTDQLNRQVTILYADFYTRLYDQITYQGFGGSQRTIRINYDFLANSLRTNRSGDVPQTQTAAELFPLLTGANTKFNPYIVSSVVLPDGMQKYKFLYNTYGELARATLPTGGAFEYDYGSGIAGDSTGIYWTVYSLPEISRRVLRRRVYVDDGRTLQGLTTYSAPEVDFTSYVQIDHFKNDQTTLLSRERHYFYGVASNSFNHGPLDYSAWSEGREYQTEYYAADGQSLLKKIVQTWDQRNLAWWTGSPSTAPPNNPFINETETTLVDSGQVTRTTHVNPQNGLIMIDQFNNMIDTWVYDYGPGSSSTLLSHSHVDFLTVNNGIDYTSRATTASPHLLSLPIRESIYDQNEIERARTTYEYDNYSAGDAFHASLKNWPAITGVAISGADAGFTALYAYRGNVTSSTRYLLNNNQITGSITSWIQYDLAGNVVKTIDPRSTSTHVIATTISYDDCFGSPDAEARLNNVPLPLSSVNQRSYSLPTLVTNALGHSIYTQYDYYLGRPVDVEDANGTLFSGYYNDVLDRPTKLWRAGNRPSSLQSQTLFTYDDVARITTTSSDLNSFGDQLLKSQILYDGLGRAIETRQYEGGNNYIAARQSYDSLGRSYQSSNPFRPFKNEIPVWNTLTFDALNRLTSRSTADGAISLTSYFGSEATVTDQIGKQKKSVSDALGRVVRVYEDPSGVNWLTSCAYDALGDLVAVTQANQSRTFAYDSLARLVSATSPEFGQVSNTYDNSGNLLSRTDARGITANFGYDDLNRLIFKTYQNDPALTPPVSILYDNQSLPSGSPAGFDRGAAIGRRVAVIYGNNANVGDYNAYDLMGRTTLKIQRTGPVNYQTSAIYNASGRISVLTYPSGHTMAYNYDPAGRVGDRDTLNLAVKGNLGDGVMRTYSSNISYNNWNSLAQEKFGTDIPIYNKLFYNSRGQIAEIRESTTANNTSWNRGAIINHYSNQCWGMCLGLSMTDNNGDLKRQDIYIPGNDQVTTYDTWADAFSYDSLDRLTQVHEYNSNSAYDWQQEYVYDRWGNRTVNQSNTWGVGIPKPNFSVNTNNNRLVAPAGYSLNYDPAGNITSDNYTGAGQRNYDGDGRMVQAWANNQWQTYTYDGNGTRVIRRVNNQETWQVYGLSGELIAEYAANGAASTPQKEYGYRNGQLLITASTQSERTENVTWTNMVGVTAVAGNSLYKTASTMWGNGGAVSTQAIVSGDGYAEFSAGSLAYGMYGLSRGDSDQGYADIDYAIYTERNEGRVYVYENGVSRGQVGTFAPNDRFRVAVEGGVVRYRKNNILLYTSTVSPASRYPLLVDTSLYSSGNTLMNVVISGNLSLPNGAELKWLVSDQLGTPRMIFDKAGSLATTKRHDYLPFGEEISSGTGVRTTTLGYTADAVRQKFTSKERDSETGLDYFVARYYASSQGRFTSPDPLLASGRVANPQSWNRYAYVLNNPLKFTDSSGLAEEDAPANGQPPQTQTPQPTTVYDFTETRLVYDVPAWETTDEGTLVPTTVSVVVNLPANAAKELDSVYKNTFKACYQPSQESAARARVGSVEPTSQTNSRTKGDSLDISSSLGVSPNVSVSENDNVSTTRSVTSSRQPQLAERINTMTSISTFNDGAIERLSRMTIPVPINGQFVSTPMGQELATNLVRMAAQFGSAEAKRRTDNSMSTVP